MYHYRVAFTVAGRQLNAWFVSPEEYQEDADSKKRFREMALMAVENYLREARRVPANGMAEEFAIWPEQLPIQGEVVPLDAFEIKDMEK